MSLPLYLAIGEEILAALDAGATQREVAEELGYSQTWVGQIVRWYLAEIGETRWYILSGRTTDKA